MELLTKMIEIIIANLWNRLLHAFRPRLKGGLFLGFLLADGRITKNKIFLPQRARSEHLVIIGKTGTGKSYFLRSLCVQDIGRRGFVYFDHHGDTTPALLSLIADEEKRSGTDLSSRVIVIRPADPEWTVGFNPLDEVDQQRQFVEVAGIAGVLKERWGLTNLGAQTEELLRNTLHVLADSCQTLLEATPLLSNSSFRNVCLKQVRNHDVREYFEDRYEPMSEGMKATVRNPVLNKLSEFVSDIHFRHILGQRRSTFSFLDALENGQIVLVDLSKGKLGKHSNTLASLLFSQIHNAIFRRRSREIYTLYCDEIQNLVSAETDIESLFSEARKFAVSIASANQFLEQFPRTMRSAIQAVGTHVAFQTSAEDATTMASMLDGGRVVADALKSLPHRQFIAKLGSFPWVHVQVPALKPCRQPFQDLLARSNARFARRRDAVETEIQNRRPRKTKTEVLDAWD